jgi:hypothetical protein
MDSDIIRYRIMQNHCNDWWRDYDLGWLMPMPDPLTAVTRKPVSPSAPEDTKTWAEVYQEKLDEETYSPRKLRR